ncbi:hypothetical protein Nepgr_025764 [Nepenthes gracilis]|uniref:Uncharacterized protein n=1 Tax=Nepenthes gracilis TaxID=150966 RepID=A0AAD3T7A1_NEPGR|nr:hypothetical protein Nepgr_025764 [Nepenthes gracilis]
MMPGKITNMEDKNFKIFASGSIQNMNPEELDEEDLLNWCSQIEPERIIEEILHAEDQQDEILEETDYAHYNLEKTAVNHENPGETWVLTTGEGENQGIDLEQTYADKENLTIRSIEDNTNQAEITGAEEQIDKETIKHETFQSMSQIEEHLNMDSEDAEAAAPSEHAKQNAFARGIESVGYSLAETRKGEESIKDDKVNENGISYKSTEADLDGMTRSTDTDISKNTNEFIDQTLQTEGEKQDEVSKFELEEQIQKANDVSSEEKYIKEASEVSKSTEYESSEGRTTEEAATEGEGQRKIYDMEAENKNAEEILETDKQRKETSSIVFQEVTVESDDTRKRIVEDAPIVSIPAHTEDETIDKSFNGVNLDGTALDICGEDSSHPAEDNPTREPFINEEELVMGKIGNKITEEENISEQAIEDIPQELTQGNAIQRSQDDNMEAANSWTEDRKEQIIEAGHVTGITPQWTIGNIVKTYAEDVRGEKEFQELETASSLNSTALEPQHDPDETLDSSTVKCDTSTKKDKTDLPPTELLINKNIVEEEMYGQVNENVNITEEGSLIKQSKDDEGTEQNLQKASPEDRPTKALNGVNELGEAALEQTSDTEMEEFTQTSAETSDEHKEEKETVGSDKKKENETSTEDKASEESRFRESIDWKLSTTDNLEVDNQERGSNSKIEEQPDTYNPNKSLEGRIKEEISGADSRDDNEECMGSNEALCRDISFHNGEEAVDTSCQENRKVEHYNEQATSELSHLTNEEVYMGPQNDKIDDSTKGFIEEVNPYLVSIKEEIIRSSQETDGEVTERQVEMHKEHKAGENEDFGNMPNQETTTGDHSTEPTAEEASEKSTEAVQTVAEKVESDEGLGEVYGTGSSDCEKVSEKNIYQEKAVLTGEEHAADEAGDDVEQEKTDEAPEARPKVEDEIEAATAGNPSDDVPEETIREISGNTEEEMQLQEEDNSRNTNVLQKVSAEKGEENTSEKINDMLMPLESYNQGNNSESGDIESQEEETIHAVSESSEANKSRIQKDDRGNQGFGKVNLENASLGFEAFKPCIDNEHSSLKTEESAKYFSNVAKDFEEQETATVDVDHHHHENEASNTVNQYVPAEEVKESSGKEPEVSRASETLEKYPLPKDESQKPEDIPGSACKVSEETIKEENIGAADHHNQTHDHTSAAIQRDKQSLQEAQLQENLLEVIEVNENKKNQQVDDKTEIAPDEEVDSNNLQGTLKVALNLPDIENDNRGKVGETVESLTAQEVAEIGVPGSAPEPTEEAPRETNENPFKEKMSSDDTAEGTKELNEVVFHTNYHDVEPTPKDDITSSQISPLNKTRQQSEHKLSELLQDEKEHEFLMPIKDTEDDNTNEVQVLKATGTNDFSSEKIRETAVEEVLTIDEAPILKQGDRSSQMPFINSISESNTNTESNRPIDSCSREALDDKDIMGLNNWGKDINISPESYSTGEHISQENYGKICEEASDSNLQNADASEHILELHDVIFTGSEDNNTKEENPEAARKKPTISGNIPEEVTKELLMLPTKEDDSLTTALNNTVDETSPAAKTMERIQLEKEDESRNSKMLLQLAENKKETRSQEMPENKDENLHMHPPELNTQSNISESEEMEIKKEEETHELKSTEDKQKTLKEDERFEKDNFGNENPNDEAPMVVYADGPHIDAEDASPKQDECGQIVEHSKQKVADVKEVVAPAELEHPKQENEASIIVTDCASAEQVPKYSEICGETEGIREEITEEKSNAENLHQAIIGGKTNLQEENSNLVSIQNQVATFLNKVENMNSEEKESTYVKQEASTAARTLNDCATLGEIKRPEDVPRTVSEVPEESIKEDNQETADKYNNKVDNTSMTTVTEEESLQETQQQENLSHSDGSTEKNQQTREKTGNAQEREEVDSVADYSYIDREHSGKKIVTVENQAACESSEMERILGTVNNPEDEASSETATNPTVEKLYLDELPPDGRKQDAPISIKDTEEVNPNEVGVLKAEGADDSFSEKILEETCLLDEAPRETAVSDSGYESSVNLHPKESTEEVQMIDPSSILEYGDSLLQIPSANPPSETEKKTLPDRPIDSCSQNNDFSLHGHPPGEQIYEESFGNSYKGQSDSNYQKTGTSGHIQKLPDEVVTESEETNFKERHLQAASRMPTTQEYQWEKASEGDNVIASETSFSEVEREGSIKESNKQSQDEDTETPSQQDDKLMDEESTMMEENQVSITRTNEILDDQVPKELEINEKNESVQEEITEEESDAKKLHRVITGERTAQEMSFLIDSDSMPILNHETTDLNKRTDTMSSCIEVSPQEGTTDTTQTTDSIQEIRPPEEAPGNDEEHEQAESNPIATIQLIDPAGKAAAGVQPQSATEENLLTDEVENSMIEKGKIPDGADQEKTGSEGKEKVRSVTMDSTEISSDLQQMSAAETYQMEGRLIEKGEPTENNERMQTKEVETVENSKTDEEKEEAEEEEEEEGDEHKDNDPDSKAQVMVDAPKDTNIKGTHKKSHNILSGIKHSISKVKKAITGKSSHHKTSPPK